MTTRDTADGVDQDFRAALARERYLLVAFVAAACRGRSLGTETVEDLVQETFTIAWTRRAEFDTGRPLGPWLRGVATNVLIGVLRRHARQRRILDEARYDIERVHGLADRFDRFTNAAADREIADGLRDCVHQLPDAYRNVIERHYADGQRFGAIAAASGVSEEVALKRASRARAMLAECMERKQLLPRESER